MKNNKFEYGYIKKRKRKQSIYILLLIALCLAIFGIGYWLNQGDIANLFTVLSILGVLPMAKLIITFVLFLPYKEPVLEQYEQLKSLCDRRGLLLCDLVFTSSERVMHLDYLFISDGKVLGYGNAKTKHTDKIEAYLQKILTNEGAGEKMTVFTEFSRFTAAIEAGKTREEFAENLEEHRSRWKRAQDTITYTMV